MNLIQLIKKLISTPSFVDNKTNEKKLGDFVYDYLKGIPYLQVEKQQVEGNRFNIIAKDGSSPKLLFACHLDTVEPKTGGKYDQFSGKIKDNRLYGLGAYDMKGGTACVLDVLKEFTKTKGLVMLFYCDEEYEFKGMRRFLQEYRLKPRLAVFPEPTDLKIINGCRGVMEIYFMVRGKTAHAARPKEGKNAIDGLIKAVDSLKKEIEKTQYRSPALGLPTLNLAFLSGGLKKGINKDRKLVLGDRGNNVPDVAEAVLDIRIPNQRLNAKKAISFLRTAIRKQGLSLSEVSIRSDFNPTYVPTEKLRWFEEIIRNSLGKTSYGNVKEQGYFDGEMLYRKLGIPCVYFGPKGDNAHGVNEWVDVKSLKGVRNVYLSLIQKVCL